jgi:TonB family protein
MIHNKSTLYPLAGSLAVNMILTMGAGSFLININKSLATQKTYKLEFVKRKTPPPVIKKKTRKEVVRKEVKLASLKAKTLPVTKPIIQPKVTVKPTSTARPAVSVPNYVPKKIQSPNTPIIKSTVIHTSASTMSKRVTSSVVPTTPRSFASVNNKKSQKGTTRMAMVKGANHLKTRNIPKPVTRTSSSTSAPNNSKGRITSVLSRVKHASLTVPANPREVPSIVDRSALKSYIGQVQRIIEGAKQYPEASRKAGREGKVKIQFTIFKDGKVGNIKLLTRTPYPNLNKEAMDAVKRAAPFTGLPESYGEKYVNIILPFRFELH